MAPINLPDGTEVSEVILPDGATASEVVAPDGSAVFSAIPDSIVAQFDARQLSGFADGDSVTTRPDQSGNGNDASGSGTYRSSEINGNAAVEYDPANNDQHSVSFGSNISQRVVVFAVTQTQLTSQGSKTDPRGVVAADTNRSWFSEPQGNGNGFNVDAGSSGTQGGTTNTNPTLLTAIFDGANTELRDNGTTVIGPTDLGSADWDGISIGYLPFLGGRLPMGVRDRIDKFQRRPVGFELGDAAVGLTPRHCRFTS